MLYFLYLKKKNIELVWFIVLINLQKLPFTIPELVQAAPCRSSDGILYTGQISTFLFFYFLSPCVKQTVIKGDSDLHRCCSLIIFAGKKQDVWFVVDPETGEKQTSLTTSTSDSICPNSPLLYIGRTGTSAQVAAPARVAEGWRLMGVTVCFSQNMLLPCLIQRHKSCDGTPRTTITLLHLTTRSKTTVRPCTHNQLLSVNTVVLPGLLWHCTNVTHDYPLLCILIQTLGYILHVNSWLKWSQTLPTLTCCLWFPYRNGPSCFQWWWSCCDSWQRVR